MLPDIESLRCFEAAADRLNFRAAAAAVHLSPAALGTRIKKLESDLGVALFERTTRSVALTVAGEHLVPQARRTLAEARRCFSVAAEGAGRTLPYELTVGTRFELGTSWLVPGLDHLERCTPERRVALYFGDSADLLARAERGLVDCLVSSVRLTTQRLAWAPLHEERYEFVARRDLIAKTPLSKPEHAAQHTLIDAHPDLPLFRYFLDSVPPEQVWAFKRVECLGTIAAIRMRVLEGAGVAVLPRYYVREMLKDKRLARLKPKVKLQHDFFRLVWRESHPEGARIRRLAEDLRSLPLR